MQGKEHKADGTGQGGRGQSRQEDLGKRLNWEVMVSFQKVSNQALKCVLGRSLTLWREGSRKRLEPACTCKMGKDGEKGTDERDPETA